MRNGLAWEYDDVCYFQSQHGHRMSTGYFRLDAMPYRAVIHLLRGGTITLVDATRRRKLLTDAFKFGVPTWCGVFNRAIRQSARPCDWYTREMESTVRSDIHKPVVQTIRKLTAIYGAARPAVIGENVLLECHQGFTADDDITQLRRLVQ